ncbi:hypothetical protein ACUODJ_59105, partial [Escherichia sp. HC-CC]
CNKPFTLQLITYLGYQSDVKPFVKEAHCLIQASHGGEGLSNVLLEAAATWYIRGNQRSPSSSCF